MFSRILLGCLWVILLGGVLSAVAPPTQNADEVSLRKLGLPVDADGLIRFLRERSRYTPDPEKTQQLVRELGDDTFAKREDASRKLKQLGHVACRELGRALKNPDLELRRRAQVCLSYIERGTPPDSLWHAVRLLGHQRPPRATQALLAFLPSAPDEEVEEAVYHALARTAYSDGKPDTALLEALEDAAPARRAVAACLLAKSRTTTHQAAVRKRLNDPNPTVRLRAAQGLLANGDTFGLRILVELLDESCRDIAWQAEELLRYVAADDSPQEVVGHGKREQRRRCQAAWHRWLREKGRVVNLDIVRRSGRRPGLVLVLEGPAGEEEKQTGAGNQKRGQLPPRVVLCGCEGQPRCEAMPFAEFVASRLPVGSHRQLACNLREWTLGILAQLGMKDRLWSDQSVWVYTGLNFQGRPCKHLVVRLTAGARLLDLEASGYERYYRIVEQDSVGQVTWESVFSEPVAAQLICPLVRFGFVSSVVENRESEAVRLSQIGHRDLVVRRYASSKLRAFPRTDAAIRTIARRLDLEEDETVRLNLLEALQGLGKRVEPAIPNVARQMGGGRNAAFGTAMLILSDYGPKAQDAVLKAYRDPTGKYAAFSGKGMQPIFSGSG